MHKSVITLIICLIAIGCAGVHSPVNPSVSNSSVSDQPQAARNSTVLWGLFEVSIDPETHSASATENRQAAFTANIVDFLNSKPAFLGFKVKDIIPGPQFTDLDLDISIVHPFPGHPSFNGYDVRGVFMGDGSGELSYNPDLKYPVDGQDQMLIPDPDDGTGGPDGYTRWFNPTEFSGTKHLFEYTQGIFAYPGFNPPATLNPYRYFADGLSAEQNLWTWLVDNPSSHGVFSSGMKNTRNYYIRFPSGKTLKFAYAILADWKGPDPDSHPANASEPVACLVDSTSSVWFSDLGKGGGSLRLDISVFDWGAHDLSSGVMEDLRIFVDSTVLSAAHEFSQPEMTPIAGGEHFSTYHAEIPADSVHSLDGNEFWVIVETAGCDYSNPVNAPNDAWNDPLAAFFRFPLPVSDIPPVALVCDLHLDQGNSPQMPFKDWAQTFTFDATGSFDASGSEITYEWDFDGDGVFGDPFDSGTPDHPAKFFDFVNKDQVCLRISNGLIENTCCLDVDIEGYPYKNINVSDGTHPALDLAIDSSTGDLLVYYRGIDSSWTGHVRRYLRSTFFTTFETYDCFWASRDNLAPYNPDRDYHETGDFIDSGPTGDFIIAAHRQYASPPPSPCTGLRNVWAYIYSQSGQEITHYWWNDTWSTDWQAHVLDAHAFGSNSPTREGDLGITWEYGSGGVRENNHVTWPDPVYSGFFNLREGGTGLLKPAFPFHGYHASGTETDRDTDYIWVVMRENTVAELFQMNPSYPSTDSFVEIGPRFGTYSPDQDGHTSQPYENADTSDNGLFCALDITRDNENQYYVLDRLGLEPPYAYRIKTFTCSLMPPATTPHGGFGGPSDWLNDPIRLEGSDYDANIIVLHVTGSSSMISLFLETEIP
jgi:hypothetical protein